jgi:hypothetical protein
MKYLSFVFTILLSLASFANGPLDAKWTAKSKKLEKMFILKPAGEGVLTLRMIDTCSEYSSGCLQRDESFSVKPEVKGARLVLSEGHYYVNFGNDEKGNVIFASLSVIEDGEEYILPLTFEIN